MKKRLRREKKPEYIGMPSYQIAEILNITIKDVNNIIYNAIEKLRKNKKLKQVFLDQIYDDKKGVSLWKK